MQQSKKLVKKVQDEDNFWSSVAWYSWKLLYYS
jgi:hypothetical protein